MEVEGKSLWRNTSIPIQQVKGLWGNRFRAVNLQGQDSISGKCCVIGKQSKFVLRLTIWCKFNWIQVYVCICPLTIWRRQWQHTPMLLPGTSQGQGSLVGYSPWGREESDTTERLHFHFSLSCIGEGHGNPLRCSCLENPRDRGAWWAAVYGVAQSRTRLKQLSSSSSSIDHTLCTKGAALIL